MAATHPDPAFPRFHPRPAQLDQRPQRHQLHQRPLPRVLPVQPFVRATLANPVGGHVSSADLVHWEEYPVALSPQPGGPDSAGCWTGVVTLDGFVPTACYSGVQDHGGHSQVVIARGSADLVTWKQDGHVAASMPADPLVTAVRDPFIFHFNGGARYAMQGAGLADGRAALLLYTVESLDDWKYQGIWLTTADPVAAAHTPAEIWECPQLVQVPVSSGGSAWVMMFSLWLSGDDHEHANGGVRHLIGSLTADPLSGLPVFTPSSGGKADLGRDFYAPQIVQLSYGSADSSPAALLWGGWANEGPGGAMVAVAAPRKKSTTPGGRVC